VQKLLKPLVADTKADADAAIRQAADTRAKAEAKQKLEAKPH
jgi:hypothetical protein